MIRYLIIVLFTSLTLKVFAQNIQDILSKIEKDDKEELTSLFYQMMNSDNCCYTLFGDKPISLSGDFDLTPCENICSTHKCGGIFWKNWKIWEKYENDFLVKMYLFVKEPSVNCTNVTNIIFINKKEFIKMVDEHLTLFKKRLKRDVTGKSLMDEIEEKRKFASIINNDEILWGVLLGYGLHNAQLYNERLELGKCMNQVPITLKKKSELHKNFNLKTAVKGDKVMQDFESESFVMGADHSQKVKAAPITNDYGSKDCVNLSSSTAVFRFNSIEEEYNFLDSLLQVVGEYTYSPLIAGDLHFVADHSHPETKVLQKKYTELRGKISTIYAKGDFLEITLHALTSGS